MRIGSPATYVCKASKRAGMHKWASVMTGKIMTREAWNRYDARQARCMFCGLTVDSEDAADVFRGAETPIGQVRLSHTLLNSKDDSEGEDE